MDLRVEFGCAGPGQAELSIQVAHACRQAGQQPACARQGPLPGKEPEPSHNYWLGHSSLSSQYGVFHNSPDRLSQLARGQSGRGRPGKEHGIRQRAWTACCLMLCSCINGHVQRDQGPAYCGLMVSVFWSGWHRPSGSDHWSWRLVTVRRCPHPRLRLSDDA